MGDMADWVRDNAEAAEDDEDGSRTHDEMYDEPKAQCLRMTQKAIHVRRHGGSEVWIA